MSRVIFTGLSSDNERLRDTPKIVCGQSFISSSYAYTRRSTLPRWRKDNVIGFRLKIKNYV